MRASVLCHTPGRSKCLGLCYHALYAPSVLTCIPSPPPTPPKFSSEHGLSSNAALAFLPAVPMGLRASSTAQMARLGRAPLALRMQQATVDREQDVGIGQADMRKDAESLMQPCPETK